METGGIIALVAAVLAVAVVIFAAATMWKWRQQQWQDAAPALGFNYVGDDPSKGLRQPLLDYGLRSEPWLFTVDADGRIAARLEGAFGVSAFEEAVKKAMG